ncbi:disease resistance protein RUN1-like isoform X1 [Carya illinoinensis]|uniref:disease resistance protein RUN1-like isoform X1 n=1 Tax=Carya illinoinensis TaxID=32201 RepID=UPI001C720E67|nr:disease resistance protein RUN1-like isoform X1 [Carya illinoinensis]
MAIPNVSFTSPSSSHPRIHDVFLSFRGDDTRNTFTGHLHHALIEKGIKTFIDDKDLRKGDEISKLLEAIEQSKISIIIFSKTYATSTWCLDELVKILECRKSIGQMVQPIFYDVDPSDVRKFVEVIDMHENKVKDDIQRVLRWKVALKEAANLSGWHLNNGHESHFIQRIVEEISSILMKHTFLDVAKNPVGLDSHIRAMSKLLSVGNDDVRMVGIHGIGGIGKTTIAKAVYNSFALEFQSCCFLAEVRETTNLSGLVPLQETLLSETLGKNTNLKGGSVDRGITVIKERLCHKKVLLVLDDVNEVEQLEKLAGDKNWFGPGSRIIITTRDQHVLETHGVERRYKVQELSDADALQLLSLNAFHKSYPEEGYEELINSVVQYAKGLPLVLVVLGSFLCGRSKPQWESKIRKMQRSLDKDIYEILKISFDALDDNEKAIFLDIACFFKGEERDFVTKIWEASDFDPVIGIQVLIERSLVNVDQHERLQMHDVIQLMGRNIVHQESPDEPGKRSRLWSHEDILHVLKENTGTYNAIQAIKLDLFGQKDILLNPSAFTRMKRLRLLRIRHARFSESPKSLSNELILLDWDGYPSPSLPSNFHPQKLVTLNMHHSKLKQFEGIKVCENLREIKFSYCVYLTCIPDVSIMANLESLNVKGCRNLVEVHQSVGFLNKLSLLNVQYCCKLRRLPDLKLPRLQILELTGCISLEKFPNIVGEIPRLRELWLNDSPNIQELPLSVEYLIGLQRISIFSFKNLRDLPRSISKLPRLRELVLRHCRNLGRFPKSSSSSSTNLGWLASSKGNKTQDKSHSVGWFPALRKLKIMYCNLEEVDFLNSLHCLSTLEELYLSGNNFVSLPASCNTGFTHLRSLALWHCNGLQQKNASIDVFPNGFGKMITTIKIRGGELPEWFRHQTREIEMCFRVPPPKNAKLAGLVIGLAFKPHFELSFCNLRVSIIISNGRQSTPIAKSYEVPFHGHELGLDGALWLLYLPRGALEWRDEITNEGDHFGVSYQIHLRTPFVKCDKYNNRLGVHFEFEQNDNMDDDDPRVIRHDPSPNNKIAILENDNCCQLQQQLAEQHERAKRGQSKFLSDL